MYVDELRENPPPQNKMRWVGPDFFGLRVARWFIFKPKIPVWVNF
jgi:hypothetical protein